MNFFPLQSEKKGQNVRLASKLTGWHLDVQSETRYSQAMQIGYDSLVTLPGVGISLADALYESGFYSVEEMANANIEDLIQIRGIGEEKAEKLLQAAKTAAAASSAEAVEDETAEQSADVEPVEAVADGEPVESVTDGEPLEAVAEEISVETTIEDAAAEDEIVEAAAENDAAEPAVEDDTVPIPAENETAEPDDLSAPSQPSGEPESKES